MTGKRYIVKVIVKDNMNGVELGDSTELETSLAASRLVKDTIKYLKMREER